MTFMLFSLPSQLGLGAFVTIPCVFVPTEILLSRAYSSGTSVKCIDLAAGESRTQLFELSTPTQVI